MASRTCWHCGNKTHMTQVGNVYRIWSRAGAAALETSNVRRLAGFFTCDECRYPSIAIANREVVEGSIVDDAWFDGMTGQYEQPPRRTWLPIRPEGRNFVDVPEHIASAAGEAYACHSIGAYRGAGALARAVVEATAKDKGITSGTLAAKIAEMERRQLVRPMVRQAADEVRHMGNDVAHGDFVDPVEEEESSETLALMAEVLDEVYQAPARLEKRRAARQAKKGP